MKLAKKNVGATLPLSFAYLAYAWGIGKNYPCAVSQKVDVVPRTDGVGDPFIQKKPPFVSGIDNHGKALIYYLPKKLFINALIKEKSLEVASLLQDHTFLMQLRHLKEGESLWKALLEDKKTVWACLAREHDKWQPLIWDQILHGTRANPTQSFDQISSDIGCWCSPATIHRWLK